MLFTTAMATAFFVAPFLMGEAFASVDNISKIYFTTDLQTIKAGDVSKEITVQAQDSSGEGVKMDVSGGKLSLVSSSQSGEFSASSTKWEKIVLPLTVNSNWMGRTFYYKNSVAGKDIITATLVVGGKTFTTSQDITTTEAPTQPPDDPQPRIEPNVATGSPVVTRTIIKYVSVHSNPEDLSGYSGTTNFEIYAGRERVGYVGSPIKFTAKNNLSKNDICSFPNYSWTYGDGAKDLGESISHTYKFPGEYNIVLNGACGDRSAVSRTKIKILSPEVSFNLISSGDLEIYNSGKTEINMGGWMIKGVSSIFVFPEDTIISASGKMVLAKEYSRISVNNNEYVNLVDPSNKTIFSLQNSLEILPVVTSSSTEPVSIPKQETKKEMVLVANDVAKVIKKSTSSEVYKTATILESVKSPETKGFWRSVLNLPIKGIKAVARVFYDIE